MEDPLFNDRIADFAQTAVGTNAGVSATQAAIDTHVFMVTGIDVSGDAAALVTIESPASTVLWQQRFASAFVLNKIWDHPVIKGAPGAAILVKVSASTTHSEANIYGIVAGSV